MGAITRARSCIAAQGITAALALLAGCGAAEVPRQGPRPAPVASASAPQQSPAELPLHWVGEWTSIAEQVSFTFDIRLAPVAKGEVNGRILWTLMSAPPGHFLASRIGDSGTEYVTGTWSAEKNELLLKGTSVDSPGFLVVDEYKLQVAADRASIEGHTRGSKGDWKNELHGKRSD